MKFGPNSLTLLGAESNTYTGTTIVAQGTLRAAKQNGVTTIAGPVVVEAAGVLTLQAAYEQIANTSAVANHGAFVINGATETIGSLAGNGGLYYAGGSLSVGANHASTMYAGLLSGYGVFRKVGSGTLALTGLSAAHFPGLTEVVSGGLIVDGTLASATLYGGVLGGGGSIGTLEVAGGVLDPGNPATAPGRLSVGTLTFGATGTLAMMYRNANGVFWAGGTHATARPLP